MARRPVRNTKKKIKKNIVSGNAYVHSTRNNTIVTIADENGNAIAWSSSGSIGYKGSKKSTPYAAGIASETAAKQAMAHGMKTVNVFVRGTGQGKDTAVRSLQTAGLDITSIKDITPVAHNGVKPPKRRR